MNFSAQIVIVKVLHWLAKRTRLTLLADCLGYFFADLSPNKIKQKILLSKRLEDSGDLGVLINAAANDSERWLELKQLGTILRSQDHHIPLGGIAQWWRGLYFSQEGEDILLERLLPPKERGIYLEIGAHHPLRFSNTASFYLKGWRGIVVEPDVRNQELFQKFRPEDIFVNKAIGSAHVHRPFYLMEESALNSFDKTYVDWLVNEKNYKLYKELQLEVYPLSTLISEFPILEQVDFLSIDVEGLELEVLKSNDWDKLRPTLIVIEILDAKLDSLGTFEVHQFLERQGYTAVAKTMNSVFYKQPLS